MCAILDEYAKEYAKDNERDVVRELFKNGVPFLTVRGSVQHLSEKDVAEIFLEVSGKNE